MNGVAAGGDLGGTYPDPIIAGGAVTGPKLATAAVTTGKLADGAVTATKYGTAVVRTATAVIPSEGSRSANAPCAAGERAVAGGGSLDGFAADINLISSRPAASGAIFELPANGQPFDAWRATAIDTAAGGLTNVSVRAHVVCLQ